MELCASAGRLSSDKNKVDDYEFMWNANVSQWVSGGEMLERLKQAFQSLGQPQAEPSKSQSLKLATAFLLIETGRSDHAWDAAETDRIITSLASRFELAEEDAHALLDRAHAHADQAVSLYDTVSLINDHCSMDERRQILLDCWRVAFADGILDRHEEHLIRQLGEWLYLSHQDFIQLKHKAEAESGQ